MLEKILSELSPTQTKLVAVSKTKPVDDIMRLYEQGQRIFGENRALELAEKYETLPKDIQWHFIGHLQRNKVKYIAPFVSMIHAVDSIKLLQEIDKQASRYHRTIDCLLQFHIAEEETKYGLDFEEAKAMLQSDAFAQLKNVRLAGVMGMATFTSDLNQVRREFKQLCQIHQQLKDLFFDEADAFQEISMGMSGDYHIAVAEGSTMVRIGTLLFRKR